MLSMRQLRIAIDSLIKEDKTYTAQYISDNFKAFRFPKLVDSAWEPKPQKNTAKSFDELLPDSTKILVNQSVKAVAGNLKLSAESYDFTLKAKEKNIRKHKIRFFGGNRLQCLAGIFCLAANRQIRFVANELGQALAHHRVVIDNEQFLFWDLMLS